MKDFERYWKAKLNEKVNGCKRKDFYSEQSLKDMKAIAREVWTINPA